MKLFAINFSPANDFYDFAGIFIAQQRTRRVTGVGRENLGSGNSFDNQLAWIVGERPVQR
jgi:hypothetical protein